MTIYTTSFSEYTDDTQLSDWTAQWDSAGTEWLKRSAASEYDNAYLEYSGSYNDHALSWDDAGSAVEDVDIVIVFKPTYDAVYGDSTQMVIARGGGTGAAPTGYIATLRNGYYRIAKYYNTIIQNLDTSPSLQTPTLSTSKWYALRFQVNGTDVKARYWEVGNTEPGTWDLEGIDNDYTSGWCGVGATSPTDIYFDLMSIGTDSDAGELPPDLSGELDATLPALRIKNYDAYAYQADHNVGWGFLPDLGITADIEFNFLDVDATLPDLQIDASSSLLQGIFADNLVLPPLRLDAEFGERLDLIAKLPTLQLQVTTGAEADNLILPALELAVSCTETVVQEDVFCNADCLLPALLITSSSDTIIITADLTLPGLLINATAARNISFSLDKKLPELRITSTGYCNTMTLDSVLPTLIMTPFGSGAGYGSSSSYMTDSNRFDSILLRHDRWAI